MASSFDFYTRLFNNLNNGLSTYVNDTASNVIGAITPVATTLLSIYVMLWGWAMMRGSISEPITDGVSRVVRLALVCAVALQMGHYNGFISDWLWNSPDVLAAYVGGNSGASNVNYLDTLLSKMYDFGAAYYQEAQRLENAIGIPDIGLLVTAWGIWVVGILASGYGAFLLALAKMSLAIALGVGPLFVLMLIFEPTKRFFDSWMGQVLNNVFLVMLSAAAIKLILAILMKFLDTQGTGIMARPSIPDALPAIILAVIGFLVLVQMPSMASAFGGGVAVGTLGAVSWAYGKSKGGMAAMRPTNLRRSYNRARSDARIVRGAVVAPMAVYRKVTGGTRNRVAQG